MATILASSNSRHIVNEEDDECACRLKMKTTSSYLPLAGRAALQMARRSHVQQGKSCGRQAAPAVSSPQELHQACIWIWI